MTVRPTITAAIGRGDRRAGAAHILRESVMRGHVAGDVPDDDRDDRDQPERVDPGPFPPGGQPDLFTHHGVRLTPSEVVPPRTISAAAAVPRRGTSVASPVNGIRTMMRPRPSMTPRRRESPRCAHWCMTR